MDDQTLITTLIDFGCSSFFAGNTAAGKFAPFVHAGVWSDAYPVIDAEYRRIALLIMTIGSADLADRITALEYWTHEYLIVDHSLVIDDPTPGADFVYWIDLMAGAYDTLTNNDYGEYLLH